MPRKMRASSVSLEREGKAYLFFTNFEDNTDFSLAVDEELTVRAGFDAEVNPYLPQEMQGISLLRIIYSGQLGGPGVDKLFAFSRALRLTSDAPVFSVGTLFVEHGGYYFHAEESRGWSWGGAREQITSDDCDAAVRIYTDVLRISKLEMEAFNRLTNAHRFFDNAYDQLNADMAIVGFTTALEGLLLNSEQELSFRFCLRIAQFLGTTVEEKQSLFSRAKELYVCRSKIVHGAAIRKDSELAAIYVVDGVAPMAEGLTRSILLKVYELKLVEVFESGERIDKLFTQLLFATDSNSVISQHASSR